MLAYSSIANAGYMLIGLAVAPRLAGGLSSSPFGGVEAVLFYLVAYAAMTIGAFTVLSHLSTEERPVETLDDLSGLARSHPGLALVMVVFLLSLIGMPLTAGFVGKVFLFFSALSVPLPPVEVLREMPADEVARLMKQVEWFRVLAIIGALNAAIAAWYYLRVATVMFLREPIQPIAPTAPRPALATLALCVLLTLGFGTGGVQWLARASRSAVDSRATDRLALDPPVAPKVAVAAQP
jgi:NADH-quinone oxidoreductase subunit N